MMTENIRLRSALKRRGSFLLANFLVLEEQFKKPRHWFLSQADNSFLRRGQCPFTIGYVL